MTEIQPRLGPTLPQTPVKSAITNAADKTGIGFDVLYNMAVRESSLDPTAKAKTSSAAGLFQFIENTWLGAVKQFGERHGMADIAADIVDLGSGRFSVANETRRKEILDLRFDADKASALAGELTLQNKNYLEKSLGRKVDAAELYAAHFLGPGGAKKLIAAGNNTIAADILPKAAAANKPVFFKNGAPRTVGDLIGSFQSSMSKEIREIKSAAGSAISTVKSVSTASFDFARARATVPEIANGFSSRSLSDLSELTPSRSLVLMILQALDPTTLR